MLDLELEDMVVRLVCPQTGQSSWRSLDSSAWVHRVSRLACEDLPLPPVIGSSRSALLRRLEPLAYQERESATDIRSKISGDQIVRTPAAANVDLGSGGAYPITIGIERVQKT
jgi:hypothetical protein